MVRTALPAMCQSVPDDPRWLQDDPRMPKIATKTAHDTLRWLAICSSMPLRGRKRATRHFQVNHDSAEITATGQNHWKTNGFLVFLLYRYVISERLPRRRAGSKIFKERVQRRSKGLQTAARATKSVPRASSEAPTNWFFRYQRRGPEIVPRSFCVFLSFSV